MRRGFWDGFLLLEHSRFQVLWWTSERLIRISAPGSVDPDFRSKSEKIDSPNIMHERQLH